MRGGYWQCCRAKVELQQFKYACTDEVIRIILNARCSITNTSLLYLTHWSVDFIPGKGLEVKFLFAEQLISASTYAL